MANCAQFRYLLPIDLPTSARISGSFCCKGPVSVGMQRKDKTILYSSCNIFLFIHMKLFNEVKVCLKRKSRLCAANSRTFN